MKYPVTGLSTLTVHGPIAVHVSIFCTFLDDYFTPQWSTIAVHDPLYSLYYPFNAMWMPTDILVCIHIFAWLNALTSLPTKLPFLAASHLIWGNHGNPHLVDDLVKAGLAQDGRLEDDNISTQLRESFLDEITKCRPDDGVETVEFSLWRKKKQCSLSIQQKAKMIIDDGQTMSSFRQKEFILWRATRQEPAPPSSSFPFHLNHSFLSNFRYFRWPEILK